MSKAGTADGAATMAQGNYLVSGVPFSGNYPDENADFTHITDFWLILK